MRLVKHLLQKQFTEKLESAQISTRTRLWVVCWRDDHPYTSRIALIVSTVWLDRWKRRILCACKSCYCNNECYNMQYSHATFHDRDVQPKRLIISSASRGDMRKPSETVQNNLGNFSLVDRCQQVPVDQLCRIHDDIMLRSCFPTRSSGSKYTQSSRPWFWHRLRERRAGDQFA